MKHKSILKEFFGLSQKSINLGGNTFELGKVYSNPYARAFNPQPTNEDVDDDYTDEYDVENEYDYEDFISFLKTKTKEKDAYNESVITEAEYQGHKVTLNKPMQGDVKKFKVYVKNDKGNVVKVNFGFGGSSAKGKRMSIKKNNPERRKNFRARHNCDNPGPRWKARYWSCRKW